MALRRKLKRAQRDARNGTGAIEPTYKDARLPGRPQRARAASEEKARCRALEAAEQLAQHRPLGILSGPLGSPVETLPDGGSADRSVPAEEQSSETPADGHT
jgi:hypothetical protein